jgi:hypothetical protein
MATPLAAMRMIFACAVAISTAVALTAVAAPYSWREALSGRITEKSDEPVIGRYQTDEGGVFILDRSTPHPLLKFEDDPEIWVLQPAKGPRGDVIYRNDLGEEMLRFTSLGGMTVFTEKRPAGSAAAFDGASSPLRIQPLSPAALFTRFYQASVRASRAARHQVGFETREVAEPKAAAFLADAAVVASEALVDMAARPNGKALLSRINDVVIAEGSRPSVVLQRGVLTVTIDATQGVFGRPSSRRIEWAAGAR